METSRERNRQIYEERKKGAKYAELQEKYDISAARANEIFQREEKRENDKQKEVLAVLHALCDDEKMVSRTTTVLERLGATSVEMFLGLDEKKVKKARNCGPVMQELIMKMREEIEKKYAS